MTTYSQGAVVGVPVVVPVLLQEYASNSNVAATAVDTTSFSSGSTGTNFSASWVVGTNYQRLVRLSQTYQTGDKLILEVDQGAGNWTDTDKRLGGLVIQNVNSYGVRLLPTVGSTDVNIHFTEGGSQPGTTYGATGSAWSALSAWKWRLRFERYTVVAYGAGLATNLKSGLTPATGTLGQIRLQGETGVGSTNTAIRRFTNVLVNTGSDVTYSSSTTLGDSLTINTAGVYALTYTDIFNAVATMGVSVNSSQLTTSIGTITAANRLTVTGTPGANALASCGYTGFFSAGDVIRAHTDGAANSVNLVLTLFTIQRLS